MKRWMILIALCLFPSLVPRPVHAVQLEQGWYFRWGYTALYGTDYSAHTAWLVSWFPASTLGTLGPVLVSDTSEFRRGRQLTIPQTANVPEGVLFQDTGRYEHVQGNYYQTLCFDWESNYDASKVEMQIVRRRINGSEELVWTQALSGQQIGSPGSNALSGSLPFLDGEELRFQLVVVPEPQAFFVLICGLLSIIVTLPKKPRRLAPLILLLGLTGPVAANLTPDTVAVVANTNSNLKANPSDAITMSQVAARYYCQQTGIPLANILEVNAASAEVVGATDYADLAADIRSKLISQLGVDPNDPASDPIQALVLCYGIPSQIAFPGSSPYQPPVSVDSFLTLLFNKDPDLQPGDTLANGQHLRLNNPYSSQDTEFSAFRASASDSISLGINHYKLRYLVCRLEAYEQPRVPVSLPGTPSSGVMPRDVRDMIDRAAASSNGEGRFVIDEPWDSNYGAPQRDYQTAAQKLSEILDPAIVVHDGTSAGRECYVGSWFQDSLGVIGYASYGMHDRDIVTHTVWGRTGFNWKPGSVAIRALTSASGVYVYAGSGGRFLPPTPRIFAGGGLPVTKVRVYP